MIRISVGWSLASILAAGRLAAYFAEIDVLGLAVRADNASAIACCRGLGFEVRHAEDERRVVTMLAVPTDPAVLVAAGSGVRAVVRGVMIIVVASTCN
jgi:hypothetical protein